MKNARGLITNGPILSRVSHWLGQTTSITIGTAGGLLTAATVAIWAYDRARGRYNQALADALAEYGRLIKAWS